MHSRQLILTHKCPTTHTHTHTHTGSLTCVQSLSHPLSLKNDNRGEWQLNERPDSLEVDQEVYGAHILKVGERVTKRRTTHCLEYYLEGEKLEGVCKEIVRQWVESCAPSATKNKEDIEVLAIASLIEYGDKSLFQNSNMEEHEKNKLAKQDRKDNEKKRTQKGKHKR
uniref:Uncharacterized protein n=1 Tax=Hucho hucho TaxID=62062 RepID=A0A4W5JH58_9TELE